MAMQKVTKKGEAYEVQVGWDIETTTGMRTVVDRRMYQPEDHVTLTVKDPASASGKTDIVYHLHAPVVCHVGEYDEEKLSSGQKGHLSRLQRELAGCQKATAEAQALHDTYASENAQVLAEEKEALEKALAEESRTQRALQARTAAIEPTLRRLQEELRQKVVAQTGLPAETVMRLSRSGEVVYTAGLLGKAMSETLARARNLMTAQEDRARNAAVNARYSLRRPHADRLEQLARNLRRERDALKSAEQALLDARTNLARVQKAATVPPPAHVAEAKKEEEALKAARKLLLALDPVKLGAELAAVCKQAEADGTLLPPEKVEG